MSPRPSLYCVLALSLGGCIGSAEEVGGSALDDIRWMTPTKPVANLAVSGHYSAPADRMPGYDRPEGSPPVQAVLAASFSACQYELRWSDSTTSRGRWEAIASWDASAQQWNASAGELHLWVGDQEQVFGYRWTEPQLMELTPTSENAKAMHGTAPWVLVPMRTGYRPECAWPAEDLSCLAMSPPAQRAADCTMWDSWQELDWTPFRVVGSVHPKDIQNGVVRNDYEFHAESELPSDMASIACVEYTLQDTHPDPSRKIAPVVRLVCDAARTGFAIREVAFGLEPTSAMVVTRAGGRTTFRIDLPRF